MVLCRVQFPARVHGDLVNRCCGAQALWCWSPPGACWCADLMCVFMYYGVVCCACQALTLRSAATSCVLLCSQITAVVHV